VFSWRQCSHFTRFCQPRLAFQQGPVRGFQRSFLVFIIGVVKKTWHLAWFFPLFHCITLEFHPK
jgi:hypothetical protein